MKRLLPSVITLFVLLLSISMKGIQQDTSDFITKIKSQSVEIKINGLISLAYYHKQISGNHKLADSLSKEALLIAHLHENNRFICYTAIVYSELCNSENVQNSLNYLNEGKEVAARINNSEFSYLLLIHESSLLTKIGQYKKARESIQKAVNFFEGNKSKKAYYYLVLGDLQSKDNEKINCFENYNKAIYNAKDLENDSLLIHCYLRMYEFYLLNNNNIKAKENLSLASETINQFKSSDKSDSLLVKANLIEIYTRENKEDFALKLAEELLKYSTENGYLNIKDRVFGTMRKHYLSNNKHKEICDLYCVKYPNELERLKTNDLTIYYRVNALIFENQNKIDSALYYLNLAEEKILKTSNDAGISNFFKRKGQFYLRQNKPSEALHSFENAFNYSLKSEYFPYIIESASILDSIYMTKGDFTKAYHYAKIKYTYTDSNITLLQNDKFLEIEIENIDKLRTLQLEKEELAHTQKSNFQVLIIIFCILLSLIILVLISSYKIPASVIKGFGYITFVMLFEFIILILDTKIHHWAHGQPLKILAVKIVLIAIILPLHHATEHKVVHYLLKNKLVSQGSTSIKTAFLNLKEWLSKLFKNEPNHSKKDSEINGEAEIVNNE